MPYTPFTFHELKYIFQQSEAAKGHAGARHVDISNAGMVDRFSPSRSVAITSFIKFDDQINAALELLNAPENDAAFERFRTEKKPGRGYPGSNSRYAEITHRLMRPVQMRYVIGGGTRTFPCSLVTLVFDKAYGRQRDMHIVTCFGEFG